MTDAEPIAVDGNRRLAGQTCIVTGAASGIGRAIARVFARHGAHVVVADISETVLEGGEPTVKLIAHEGGSASFRKTDVSDATAVDALVADTSRLTGRLDVIVNNACIRHARRLAELEEGDWDRMMAVNLKGVFLCCRAAVRQMLTQEIRNEARGRIINLSSQHGMIAAPDDLAYGVGKAGIAYLTRQVAADYAADGIICNAVAPGKIVTGQGGRLLDEAVLDRARRRTPWPRFGRPDDVAQAALFLASGEASFVTGINLMVDGGWMAA
ncbi:SDR family NAD(P)-dependent oxidoreductase [Methylobacterium nodulans]|uniref:Short-chain dehydrogenase/reductase SDR n=1 Tax=Methylobacterium nodulans (strain LMG 21967 / CNCM I-2342 / ORS 2060) TaxID=460265 RepID=B8IWP3_METNO|nr:glucose 1-dehydrogenase [Methylobacterium nodulans]ACL62934.1 short-chain dehydrogenase/reductase SDR [Methylobacterium nodulans ORS 2060]